MFHREMRFVGINSTAGSRPMQYAILDGDLKLHALGTRDMEGLLALVGGLETAIVAIGAPQRPNQRVLTEAKTRRRLNLDPQGETWTQWRLCEFELKRRNIRLHNTPHRAKDAPLWMQTGFKLFERLKEMGFHTYDRDRADESLQVIEVQSHASYTVLLERRPFLKGTLEGRLQRQLVLHLEGLAVANPNKILKGIHREHLLRSQLPLDGLQNSSELDTLVNAYTAFLAVTSPERTIQVGDKKEGQIIVPSMQLKDFYV